MADLSHVFASRGRRNTETNSKRSAVTMPIEFLKQIIKFKCVSRREIFSIIAS